MPRTYRVGAFVRFNNAVMRSLLRLGARFGTFAILIVPGRKTGRPIQIPLVVFPYGDNHYLVASYGVVNWVRNLRAAGGRAKLSRGRRTEQITTTELSPEQAAPILRYSLRNGPPGIPRPVVRVFRRFFVLPYLDVHMDSSLQEFQRTAASHPVFQIAPSFK
jgi:deazaflavin-dependent oxidoreductase (nitroreductase family)